MSCVYAINLRRVLGALALCAALGGCTEHYLARRDAISPSAGDALATDRVTMMVDPWPRAAGNRNIAFNGERMQAAAERYRKDKVKPPVSMSTSSASYQSPSTGGAGEGGSR
jgi:hypothetical protein